MPKIEIRSPLPGTFYRKPSPDDPAYKETGDVISKGDVIGLIEVMKSFHQISSDHSGTISSFHVENEEAVTAGQLLAEVES